MAAHRQHDLTEKEEIHRSVSASPPNFSANSPAGRPLPTDQNYKGRFLRMTPR